MSNAGPPQTPNSSTLVGKKLLDFHPGAQVGIAVAASSLMLIAITSAIVLAVALSAEVEPMTALGETAVKAADATNWVVLPLGAIVFAVATIDWFEASRQKYLRGTAVAVAAVGSLLLISAVAGAFYDRTTASGLVALLVADLFTIVVAVSVLYLDAARKGRRRAIAKQIAKENKHAEKRLRARVVSPHRAVVRLTISGAVLSVALAAASTLVWFGAHHTSAFEDTGFFIALLTCVAVGSASTMLGSFTSATLFFTSAKADKRDAVRRFLWLAYFSSPALVTAAVVALTPSVRSLGLPFLIAWAVALVVSHLSRPKSGHTASAPVTVLTHPHSTVGDVAWSWVPGQAILDYIYFRSVTRNGAAKAQLQSMK